MKILQHNTNFKMATFPKKKKKKLATAVFQVHIQGIITDWHGQYPDNQMKLCSSSRCLDPWMELAHIIFLFFLITTGLHMQCWYTGRNADDLRTELVPLSLLYKPLQSLVNFSSFQFPSQHLINLIFFVHWEIGTHCKFWMQTIEKSKVWLQLYLPHKPFIFWWILVPGIDLCISYTNKTEVTKAHPTNKPNYWYLSPDTVSRAFTSAFFYPNLSGVWPNFP